MRSGKLIYNSAVSFFPARTERQKPCTFVSNAASLALVTDSYLRPVDSIDMPPAPTLTGRCPNPSFHSSQSRLSKTRSPATYPAEKRDSQNMSKWPSKRHLAVHFS